VWSKLSAEERSAAAALGYDEAKWRINGAVPSVVMGWEQMKAEDRTNWTVLGWSSHNWTLRPVPINQLVHTEGKCFATLAKHERVAARLLGYTSELWDTDAMIPALGANWDEMGEGQREAWEVLGWSHETWQVFDVPDDVPNWLVGPSDLASEADSSSSQMTRDEVTHVVTDVARLDPETGIRYNNQGTLDARFSRDGRHKVAMERRLNNAIKHMGIATLPA
jgi:hypothetical protein